MQALKSIPKVLESIEDIHRKESPQAILAEYKRNVKIFIDSLTVEVLQLIDKYEKKIAKLAEQNKRLKEGQSSPKIINKAPEKRTSPKRKQFTRMPSPIKEFKGLDMIQTAKSNLFNRYSGHMEEPQKFSSVLDKYQHSDSDNLFPIQLINPDQGDEQEEFKKSKFQAKSHRKRQKQQELRHFLQTGKKSMNVTTDRFMAAIGKESSRIIDEVPNQKELFKDMSDSSQSIKKDRSVELNQSLGNICQSLNNSFVAKKARHHNRKKRDQIQEEIIQKQKRDEETSKMLKEKGLKNLLQQLRDNVESSAKKAPEVIKNSKLISCGKTESKNKRASPENVQSPTRSKKGSKVLFNPVPVDIGQKSKVLRKDSINSPLLPEKKLHSILKQSSLVLSGSLQGISAIQFQ